MLLIQILAYIGLVWTIKFITGWIKNNRNGTRNFVQTKSRRTIFYILGLLLFLFIWNYFNWTMSISNEAIARQIRDNQTEDARNIFTNYIAFEEWVNTDSYEMAYGYMSPTYRQKNSPEAFKKKFSKTYIPSLYPEPKLSISPNGLTAILYPDWDIYGTLDQSAMGLHMEKVEEKWYFTGEIVYILD